MDLNTLFYELQAVQGRSASKCQKVNGCDAKCCKVDLMKGEPSVTTHEIDLINQMLKASSGFSFYEAGKQSCKFLSRAGNCKIYEFRPIDCRAHFCADSSMSSADVPESDDLIDSYHAEHEQEFLDSVLISSHIFHSELSNI